MLINAYHVVIVLMMMMMMMMIIIIIIIIMVIIIKIIITVIIETIIIMIITTQDSNSGPHNIDSKTLSTRSHYGPGNAYHQEEHNSSTWRTSILQQPPSRLWSMWT